MIHSKASSAKKNKGAQTYFNKLKSEPSLKSEPNLNEKEEVDFPKALSIGAGLGIVSGSFLGPVGALVGSILGTSFGYWALARPINHHKSDTSEK